MPPISFNSNPADRWFGVANNAFDRLGLEGLLPNYSILIPEADAWLSALRADGIGTTAVGDPAASADPTTTRQLVDSPRCRQALTEQLVGASQGYLLVYKNSAGIATAAQRLPVKLLANDWRLRARLENKVAVRKNLGDRLHFPPYQIMKSAALTTGTASWKHWQTRWPTFVMQDEGLSDGRGTFIIGSDTDYNNAVTYLQRYPHHHVVVSQFIPGDVTSIQVCLTKYGSFASPIQQQLIGHQELARRQPGDDQFCGGQWQTRTYSNSVHEQVAALVHTLEQALAGHWQGIFGVDLIIDPQDRVWVIEINARLTALTAPLAMLQRSVSPLNFLLLHVLELAGIPYTLADPEALREQWSALPTASYVLPHNRLTTAVQSRANFSPGVYQITKHNIVFARPGYALHHLRSPDEVLIPDVPDRIRTIKPGGRLSRILSYQAAVDERGSLTPTMARAVSYVEQNFGATL